LTLVVKEIACRRQSGSSSASSNGSISPIRQSLPLASSVAAGQRLAIVSSVTGVARTYPSKSGAL
jgi:hypothetical protein